MSTKEDDPDKKADLSALSWKAVLSSEVTTGHGLAFCVVGAWYLRNRYLRAAWYYQLPHCAALATSLFAGGYLFDVFKLHRLQTRAAYVEDFKRTHADLYPVTRRLRWGDILDPWSPRR